MNTGLKAGTLARNMRKLTTLYALEGAILGSEWKQSRIKCTEIEVMNVSLGQR